MSLALQILGLCWATIALVASLFVLAAMDSLNRRVDQLSEEVDDCDVVSTTQVRILADRVGKVEQDTGLLLQTQHTQGQLLEAILGPQIDPSNN